MFYCHYKDARHFFGGRERFPSQPMPRHQRFSVSCLMASFHQASAGANSMSGGYQPQLQLQLSRGPATIFTRFFHKGVPLLFVGNSPSNLQEQLAPKDRPDVFRKRLGNSSGFEPNCAGKTPKGVATSKKQTVRKRKVVSQPPNKQTLLATAAICHFTGIRSGGIS